MVLTGDGKISRNEMYLQEQLLGISAILPQIHAQMIGKAWIVRVI
jgi:hypothetical protein